MWVIQSENGRLYSGIHILEGKTIADRHLKKIIGDQIFPKQNRNWAGWQWNEYNLNDEFWEEIEVHHNKFVNFIVSEIERVREATKEMNL